MLPKIVKIILCVVMPSPDLLYSIIGFDLSKGPLHIIAPIPPDNYL